MLVKQNIIMILACVIVIVSMIIILKMFLKKLHKIEDDFWGKAQEDAKKNLAESRAAETSGKQHSHND